MRAGFTLLELMIALAVLALVIVNVTSLMRTAGRAFDSDAANARLEEVATRTMDRVLYALAGASRTSLTPANAAPLSNSMINYQPSLGISEDEAVLGEPERIELEPATGIVRWTRNVGESDQQTVAWGDLVRALHAGEVGANVWDDNGNGLVDEAGLSFALVGDNSVRVELSLERKSESGKQLLFSLESRVTCRN
jgi:prepilin-type N-terminal cleavage/methylation domain-containing protein